MMNWKNRFQMLHYSTNKAINKSKIPNEEKKKIAEAERKKRLTMLKNPWL